MTAFTPALVNPPLLVWAREQSGYGPEPVAKRVGVKTDRLIAWERGDLKPTVRQAQELAKFYQRPFGLFFLPNPPSLPPLATEYRRLPGIVPGVEAPELRAALRLMSLRRDIALELFEEMGSRLAEFKMAAHISEGASTVGARLRGLLGITIEEQFGWRDDWQAWRRWREAVEAAGLLVFQFPKVSLEQTRGVSLLKFPLPVVGVNSKESAPGARIFTLLHELAHIALAFGHEERAALTETRSNPEWLGVEQFAEEAASAAIIPEHALTQLLDSTRTSIAVWDVEAVRKVAQKFRVTPLAMATRLRAAGALTWVGYRSWKADWDAYVAKLSPRSKGFASPVDKTLGRAGRPLTTVVLEAMDSNRITAVDACHYLNLGFHHFDKLREELRMGSSKPIPDDGN